MTLAPFSEPTTSFDAADAMANSDVLREIVYAALAELADGATEEELEGITGLDGNTLRPRLWELEGNGACRGERRITKTDKKRKNRSGRFARVYQVLA